ncbi:hypothetical protein, partial [uncultured Methylobacterium sp.]
VGRGAAGRHAELRSTLSLISSAGACFDERYAGSSYGYALATYPIRACLIVRVDPEPSIVILGTGVAGNPGSIIADEAGRDGTLIA